MAVMLAGGMAIAQTVTPYSMYGYGILNDNATSAQRAMGGVGYAMNSGRQINAMNPASYAAVDSLTFLFDMGITATKLWSKDNAHSEQDFGGGLDYITMLFPVHKKIGVSLGLVPFTSVGYSFGSNVENGSTARSGSGGLNQLYAGVGVNPIRGAYVGVNIGYLFGTTINDIYGYPSDGASTSLFERVTQVRDYHLQFGVQYELELHPKHRLTFGASFSPGKDLLGHAWRVNYYNINTSSVQADTIVYTSMRHKFSLPAMWGFGVNYQWNERLMVEADFTFQNWAKAKYSDLDDTDGMLGMSNRTRYALGAQYTPHPRGNYLQRIQFRLGGYLSHDYLEIKGNNVREHGLSLGFGLPTPGGNKTMVNLGFEWKHRQAHPDPLIKENYFNITLGINFNERWFYKYKLE